MINGIKIIFLTLFINTMGQTENNSTEETMLINFSDGNSRNDWVIVNDGVMGGLSESKMYLSENNTGVFEGTVSLDNNGGFSSTRTIPRNYELGGYNGIVLRVKGDGKKYKFRLRNNDRFDGISYQYTFTTKNNEWIDVNVPFNECVPVFRGRIIKDAGPLLPEKIWQIGFLISDKQEGEFKLEIELIKAYK